MTMGRNRAPLFKLASSYLVPLGITAFIIGTVWHPSIALSSSGDEWLKLAALMKRAETQCVNAYRKESPAAKDVKHVQQSQFSASFILVTIEEAVNVNGQNDRKQSFCIVGRRTGKAELAGPLP